MAQKKLYRLRPTPPANAKEDNVVVVMNQQQVQKHGLTLDEFGIPTAESLEEYHRRMNPHLFKPTKKEGAK